MSLILTDRNKGLVELGGIIEELGKRALGAIGVAVLCADEKGRVTFINEEAAAITGWSTTRALGEPLGEVFRLEERWSMKGGDRSAEDGVEVYLLHLAGSRLPIRHSQMELRDHEGHRLGDLYSFIDVSQQRLMAEAIVRQSGRDHVTGLLNRQAFTAHLEREVKQFQNNNVPSVFCFIDLERFKLINDTCGHDAGDALLQWVSSLLRETTRESDVVGRLGGDEFGVLLRKCSIAGAEKIAHSIRRKVRRFSFNWKERSFTVGLRIGVIQIDSDVGGVDDLLFAADHACFQAGAIGGEQIYVYRSADAAVKRRQQDMDCASTMKRNLQIGRFRLFGQAIRPLSYEPSDRLHFEVLLRPVAEDGTLGSPADVIRAAERYGGMELLDRWVIRNTLQFLKKKESGLTKRLDMCSINLSGASLKVEGLLEYIHEQIAESSIPPAKICFEITETAAVSDLSKARWLIEGVSAIGCRFALDDFGTGMASYGYLKDLQVDFLKIDGVFIKDLPSNSLNRTIVDSINQIGHFLGIETIAEFVGNQSVFDELRTIGVDYAQGYWTGKPMPLADLYKPDSVPPLPLPNSNKK